MSLPEGFSATLFAGEPDVRQPIAMKTDDRGRIWVAESYSYKEWEMKGEDRVLVFEDTDNDGQDDCLDDDDDGWLDSMDIRPLDPEIQSEWDLLRDYIPWALASIILIVALSALIVLRKRRSRVDSVPEKKVENRAMEDYVQQMIAMGYPEEYARNYAMQFADQFESQSKN